MAPAGSCVPYGCPAPPAGRARRLQKQLPTAPHNGCHRQGQYQLQCNPASRRRSCRQPPCGAERGWRWPGDGAARTRRGATRGRSARLGQATDKKASATAAQRRCHWRAAASWPGGRGQRPLRRAGGATTFLPCLVVARRGRIIEPWPPRRDIRQKTILWQTCIQVIVSDRERDLGENTSDTDQDQRSASWPHSHEGLVPVNGGAPADGGLRQLALPSGRRSPPAGRGETGGMNRRGWRPPTPVVHVCRPLTSSQPASSPLAAAVPAQAHRPFGPSFSVRGRR